MKRYDLVIVGTGPAGVQAALRAAREGRSVAVVERRALVGGVCLHTGTIPSKTLRQAVIDLSDYRTRGLYEKPQEARIEVSMERLNRRIQQVIATEVAFQERLLRTRRVDVHLGEARFVDPHTVHVTGPEGEQDIHGDSFLIAVGTEPLHPDDVPFDGCHVLDSDQFLGLDRLPTSLIVIGGGVIGSEYASIFSLLRCDVTLLNRTEHLLPFVDGDLVTELEHELTERGVRIVSGATAETIEATSDGGRVTLADGSTHEADAVLFCAGRRSATAALGLEAAGLSCDDSGRIRVDEDFRSSVSHVFAAGDVIGFPSLASASREQGRIAACRALDVPCRPYVEILPFGIYTVPEIAMVGPTEEEARRREMDIVTGIGRYEDTARGQIIGDTRGALKLIVERESRRLLGAHMIGTGATELIHLAQTAITFEAPYTYFVRTVMNYPTLSRVYKLAAWDVLEKLGD